MNAEDLSAALDELSRTVAAVELDLPTPQQAENRAWRNRIAADLAGHAARVRDLDAPLLVVVGGVTGAGKSTFVNTLLGRDTLPTGPLRPTTSVPALVCHPDDRGWFTSDRILPGLARVEAAEQAAVGHAGNRLRVVVSAALPPGLAVIDAPDVDSVELANRRIADALLDAADLWLWFTTAGKYADADSMGYLRRARQRGTALAVVVAQVHAADMDVVVADFRDKLAREGLGSARLFPIPVAAVTGGRLPHDVAAPLRDWLHALSSSGARATHRLATLSGALEALPDDILRLRDVVESDMRSATALLGDVDRAYGDAVTGFERCMDAGLPLRGEVISRWDRFVGGGAVLRATEAASNQARAWVRQLLANAGLATEQRLERQVRVAVADQISEVACRLADLAAAQVSERWAATPAGRALLAQPAEDLYARSPAFQERAAATVREWQSEVTRRVATVGAQRRVQARVMSGAVSIAATSAILVALAHAGLTGAEAGIAAAAGAANQTLLVKLLGEANLRRLVSESRQDLVERFDELLSPERARFRELVADVAADPERLARIDEALRGVRAAAPAARAL